MLLVMATPYFWVNARVFYLYCKFVSGNLEYATMCKGVIPDNICFQTDIT